MTTDKVTSRERLLIAMQNGQADRVPCTPDLSCMIPCRMTGKPYWDCLLFSHPPHWQAYLDAADYFGIDAWFWGSLDFTYNDGVTVDSAVVSRENDRILNRWTMHTPAGDLWQERLYYRDNPDTLVRRWIKDLENERSLLPYVFRVPDGYRTETLKEQRTAIGERHAIGAGVGFPGVNWWCTDTIDGGLEAVSYLLYDAPELIDELYRHHYAAAIRQVELIIDSGEFDYLTLGGSGSITLASPDLFDRFALPFIREATRLCKQAGLPTMLHSCGKERHLVERVATTTDLNCVNPLEIPPMGDCDLAEIKSLYGHKIALMGNLHTTETMLRGTVEEVKSAAHKAIDDAGQDGGFILSTGDQCGRDTPDENIFALVEVCETYGRYD